MSGATDTRPSGLMRGSLLRLRKSAAWEQISGPFFRKYVALFLAAICIILLTSAALDIWFSSRELKGALVRLQREQAVTASGTIEHFIDGIESELRWTVQLPWSAETFEQRRFDGLRLVQQAPAIGELIEIDPAGHERLRLSRTAVSIVDSGADLSRDEAYVQARARRIYYGPVHFRYDSEPYMTIAIAGPRPDSGVTVAEVDLKRIWDVITQIKVGQHGYAFVIDGRGRLIAHPDLSLVLKHTDMSALPHVQAALAAAGSSTQATQQFADSVDLAGLPVLSAYAPVAPVGWFVFIESPRSEAFATLYGSLARSAALLIAGLVAAFVCGLMLARRMIAPIQALHTGAVRIGGGDLGHRISIKTGDELESLGDQFNAMAARLEESHATLEHKVEERTHQLEAANMAKSRFLAAASHDLRQPLHALGLLVAQLRDTVRPGERRRLTERIGAAVTEMNELFNALLDVSRLDAGSLTPDLEPFPIGDLLARIGRTFAQTAHDKGLALRIVASRAWVRSDAILLERILLNLVSNAVRYTAKGGVLVGARRRGANLRIEVWDTGPGIPETQQQYIFDEFYQVPDPDHDRRGGLGLGLAIVDRFRRLLDHPLAVTSRVGKGSRFSIDVPLCAAPPAAAEPATTPEVLAAGRATGLVLIVDDDPLVLGAVSGLLTSWGYDVIARGSHDDVVATLTADARRPDVIIADFHLSGGRTGIETIGQVRAAFGAEIPAFLVSGDTSPERLQQSREHGYVLLHKPVSPMTLRSLLVSLSREHQAPRHLGADQAPRP
ncbi:MAG TPA: ATP-binding protein [Xanthobacteraceae bacterium]|nr:ATP-binding protein [Xanthobacteraceae bacterium]